MNPRQIQSEHYLKALIVVLSLYVGSFVYLELTTVKKEELLADEALYEVALEEVTEEEKEQLRQEMEVQQQSGALRSIARDANDTRPSSYENWSAQTGGASQGSPEQNARDFEAEVFAQTGGAAARERIVQESNKRIAQLKQQGQTPQETNANGAAQANQYEGAVMVRFSVNKRSAYEGNTWYVRNPGYTCGFNASGLVYLQIEVNAAGKVSVANYIADKSKNASACMIEQALKYAKLSRFSSGEGSASGWISYSFEAQ
ncbi:MAG: hypothetical protein RIR94_297 [Bacteroidota bacterium]